MIDIAVGVTALVIGLSMLLLAVLAFPWLLLVPVVWAPWLWATRDWRQRRRTSKAAGKAARYREFRERLDLQWVAAYQRIIAERRVRVDAGEKVERLLCCIHGPVTCAACLTQHLGANEFHPT